MSCPFYRFDSGLFGGDYYCTKQEKAVNSDTYYKYCRNYDYDDCPIYKSTSGSSSTGCFLTSACTAARGLPDDCRELMTLRSFRDEWLKKTGDGAALVARYYEIAPKIVTAIDAKPDRLEIYDRIYREMVAPCVELIGQGKYQETLELYEGITLELEKLHQGV